MVKRSFHKPFKCTVFLLAGLNCAYIQDLGENNVIMLGCLIDEIKNIAVIKRYC